jgi:hypothetical protein
MSPYTEPVSQLLQLGDIPPRDSWHDYRGLGLGAEHIPELIRLMSDPALLRGEVESDAVWAPIHAWRALAQLHAAEAVDPYLELLHELDWDEGGDWIREDAPEFFTQIGPEVLPSLVRFLQDPQRSLYSRWAVSDAIGRLARDYPALRAEVVGTLTAALGQAANNPEELNGGIISTLLEMKAVEAAPVIEAAFAAGHVDESIVGRWEEVQYELGLRDTPPPRPARSPVLERLHAQKAKAAAPPKKKRPKRKPNRKRHRG